MAIPNITELSADTQVTVTFWVRRSTDNGITAKQHADGIVAGTHPILTHQEFANKFSALEEELALVSEFAVNNGLTVVESHGMRSWVIASGTADTINKLFGITLISVSTSNGVYESYLGQANIPEPLIGIVENITGLDTIHKVALSPNGLYANTNYPLDTTLTPQQIAAAYNIPNVSGSGQCIGIYAIGGFTATNITSSFANIGISSPPTVNYVYVPTGAYTELSSNNPGYSPTGNAELMLDITMAGGMAPGATIAVYAGGDIPDTINYAATDSNNPKVFSCSYVGQEATFSNSYYTALESAMTAATNLGMTVVAASGDYGAYGASSLESYPTYSINYPASHPKILAVGGSELQINTNGTYGFETVWNGGNNNPQNTGLASGGGVSSYYYLTTSTTSTSAASYQNIGLTVTKSPNSPPTTSTFVYQIPLSSHVSSYFTNSNFYTVLPGTTSPLTMRGIPDVSAPSTGLVGFYYYNGSLNFNQQVATSAGTSASAPLWAGIIARLNQLVGSNVGDIHNTIYANPQIFNDITVGSNNVLNNSNNFLPGYYATTGWDAATGLGSPNGPLFFQTFGASVVTVNSSIQTIQENSTNNVITLGITGSYSSLNIVSNAGNGTTTVSGLEILYTPNNGFYGSDSFTYTATGPYNTSNIGTVTLNVQPIAPITGNVTQTVLENSSNNNIVLSVTGTYYNVSVFTEPTYGTITISGPTVFYTPNTGYYGPDTFTYQVVGPGGTSNTSDINITVAALPPTAGNSSQVVAENSTNTNINLITNYATSIDISANPTHGSVVVSGIDVTYTPNTNYYGSDNFSYYAIGPGGTSTVATVSITVTPNAPSVSNTSTTVLENSSNNIISIPSSFFDSLNIVTNPSHGSVTSTGTHFVYKPNTGYYGSDAFAFTATGPGGTSTVAAVSITVTPLAPVITGFSLNVKENSSNNIINVNPYVTNTYNVLDIASPPTQGTVKISGLNFIYTPNPGFSGIDAFLYSVGGPGGSSGLATIAITILPLPPITNTVNQSVYQDSTNNVINLSIENSYYVVNIISEPTYGTAVISGTNILYTPPGGKYGPDIFEYNVSGNGGTSDTSTVFLTITPTTQIGYETSFNNLGTIYSSSTANTYFFSVKANDPAAYLGPVTYTNLTSLPPGLSVDTTSGYIWGTLPNIGAYETSYTPVIKATKNYTLTGTSTYALNTLTLTVRNYNQSSIEWINYNSLGSITTGTISTLAVEAVVLNSTGTLVYSTATVGIPPGLTLQPDGTITGIALSTGTYNFAVSAWDQLDGNTSTQQFSIVCVPQTSNISYTNIYIQPLLKLNYRNYYQNFINNNTIFNPEFLYRPYDSNFGTQQNVQMVLYYGIQELNLAQYVFALQQNFNKRAFAFGNVKCSTATDNSGNVIYEAVYVDIVDTSNGAPLIIYDNNNIYYPSTIDNMRTELSSLEINNGTSFINVNNDLQPLFMNSYQQGVLYPPSYMPVMVICYAKPGYGQIIVNRINESGFDFKLINFEIDRIYIQNVLDSTSTKYLILPRESITTITPEDNYLYGPDGVEWIFDDNDPLTLE